MSVGKGALAAVRKRQIGVRVKKGSEFDLNHPCTQLTRCRRIGEGLMVSEDADEWINAISAIICSHALDDEARAVFKIKNELEGDYARRHLFLDPDYKPLANLFRSGKPIPPNVGDILAELFDPSEGNPLGVRLEIGLLAGPI